MAPTIVVDNPQFGLLSGRARPYRFIFFFIVALPPKTPVGKIGPFVHHLFSKVASNATLGFVIMFLLRNNL